MDFFKIESHIDFLKPRKIAYAISATLIVVSLVSLATRGLNFGIEFRGGVVIEAGFPESIDLPPIRSALEEAGIDRTVVQHFGSSREITVQLLAEEGMDAAATRDRIMTSCARWMRARSCGGWSSSARRSGASWRNRAASRRCSR
jgi:preprotein translocase subunit SecF